MRLIWTAFKAMGMCLKHPKQIEVVQHHYPVTTHRRGIK